MQGTHKVNARVEHRAELTAEDGKLGSFESVVDGLGFILNFLGADNAKVAPAQRFNQLLLALRKFGAFYNSTRPVGRLITKGSHKTSAYSFYTNFTLSIRNTLIIAQNILHFKLFLVKNEQVFL